MPGLTDVCAVCAVEFQFSLSRCGFCHKPVCSSCSFRIGGSVFCGKTCGHSFFYGAQEDVEEREGEEAHEDE